MRRHVNANARAYLRADKEEKTDIADGIFSAIAAEGGRFLHLRDGVYYEITRQRASEKIRASLRSSRARKFNAQEESEVVAAAGMKKGTAAKHTAKGRKKSSKAKKKISMASSSTTGRSTGRSTANSLRLKLKNPTVATTEKAIILVPGTTRILKAPPRSTTKTTAKNSAKRPTTKAKAVVAKKKVGRPKSKSTRKKKSSKIPATSTEPMATTTTETFHPGVASANAAAVPAALETTAFVPAPLMLEESHSLFLDSLPFPQGNYFPTAMECFGEDGTDDDGAHDDLDVDMDADVIDFEWRNTNTEMDFEQEQSQSMQTDELRNVVSPAEYDVPDGIFSYIVPPGPDEEFGIPTASAFYRDNFPSLFQKESEHEYQRECQREVQIQVQDQKMTKQEFYDSQHSNFMRRHNLHHPDVTMGGSTEAHNDSIVTMPSEFIDLQNNLLMNMCENEYAHETTAGGSTFFPSTRQN